jgi:Ni/Co efflux regulator RcnB
MNVAPLKAAVCALVIASMGMGSLASAQGRSREEGRGHSAAKRHGGPAKHQPPQRTERWRDDHARGAGPAHDMRPGQRLPLTYRNRQYVVDDWRSHRLSAPPRGYHWVQTGTDYVLVAIATGLILHLLLSD